MRDVRNDVGVLSETIGGLGKLGRTATFAISAPLATLGTYAVQAASDFDGAMRNINSIAGMSEQQLSNLSAEVREFGATTRGGAVESANALYTVFSAGLTDTALAMETMQVATKTAEAGLADMETTTEALVASMLSYGTETMTATRASDALTAMVQVGVGSMQTFASSVSNALPSAAALGVEIEDLYGAMAFMTQRGFSAAKASTSLNSAMTALVKPTDRMESAMSSLGVNGAEALIEKYGSLGQAIKAVVETTDGSGEAIAELFSNVRGKRFVDLLAKDFDSFEGSMKEFETLVDGATDKAHAEQMKSFAAQWDLMTSAVEGAAIAIGEVLLPVLVPIINGFTDIFNNLANLNPELLKLGVAFASAVTVAAPLLWLFATLLNPIGLLIGAVAALGTAFVSNMGSVENAIAGVVGQIPELGIIGDELNKLFGEDIVAEEVAVKDLVKVKGTVEDAFKATINPQSHAISLWSFYEGEGFIDKVSWDDFMDIALEGGWKGGAINVGDEIVLNFGEGIDLQVPDSVLPPTDEVLSEAQKERIRKGLTLDSIMQGSDQEAYVEMPFEWQLNRAMERIGQQIVPALSGVVTQIKTWADDNVSVGINAVASLFEGTVNTGGKTPLYNAVKSMLGGDITGALNALSPNLGTKIGDFLTEIFGTGEGEAFPKISKALGTLVTNVGNWFVNEAVPTIARSIGLFGGKVAVMLFDVFGMIGDFISGGGAESAAGDIGSFAEDSVLKPMRQGFNDATVGTEFSLFLTDLFAGLEQAFADFEEVWNALNMPVLIQGVEDFAAGVVDFATDLADADWSGLVTLAGALLSLSIAVGGVFLSAAGETIGAIGDVIADFLDVLSAIVDNDPAEMVSGLIQGLINLGVALFTFPLNIIDSIGTALAGLFDLEFPDFSEFVTVIGEELNKAIEDMTRDDPQIDVGSVEFQVQGGDDGLVTTFREFTEEQQQKIAKAGTAGDFDSMEMQLAVTGAEMVLSGIAPEDVLQQFLNDYEFTMSDEALIVAFHNLFFDLTGASVATSDVPADDIPPPVDDFQMFSDGTMTSAVAQMGTDLETAVTENQVTPEMVDEETLKQNMTDVGDAAGLALATGATQAFISGDMTPETFLNDFLVPFADNWATYFGENSAMQAATTSFITNFGIGMATIATHATTTDVAIGVASTGVRGNITSMANVIVEETTKAKGAVASLLEEIRRLATVATDLKVKVEVSGKVNIPIPSAAGGWERVPRDGMLTELHKDEMVLPADLAKNIRTMSSVPTEMTRERSSTMNNTQNTQNTVMVDGDVGVDALLEELERRGIYLT
jgi:TP901 family phage tail tape measure protein